MELIEVKSQDVRLPAVATDALTHGTPVAVTRYGNPIHVVLPTDKFRLIEPLLELLQQGVTVSPEMLMTQEDIALTHDLAEDREPVPAEEAQIDTLLAAPSR